MKFLIRDIFVITFFIAIAAMYFSTERHLLVLNTQLAAQQQQNAAARTENSELMAERDFFQADIDFSMQIDDLAKQIETYAPALQAKYSAIESLDNRTVSVRQVPMLIDRKTGIELTRIRVHVPSEREVFLKFGVASRKAQQQQTFSAGQLPAQNAQPQSGTKWEQHIDYSKDGLTLRDSSVVTTSDARPTAWETINEYSFVGPYEHELKSGLMDVDWSNNLNEKGLWEMRLFLNEQTLLTTVLELEESCNLFNSLLAKEQVDFASDERLPELFTSVRVTTSPRPLPPPLFQIHVWLDDQSSGFDPFPGAAEFK